MNAKLGSQIVGSVVIALACTNVVSAGGQLFVTAHNSPIKRLDSQSYELLGEIPATEDFCCDIEIDRYRQYIWRGTSKYDLEGNLVHAWGSGSVSWFSNFEPISNSFWQISGEQLELTSSPKLAPG